MDEKKLFKKIEATFGPINDLPEHIKIENPPFMELVLEVWDGDTDCITLWMAHYYRQNGDLCPDPRMGITLDMKNKTASPFQFENIIGYRNADTPNEKEDQACFLGDWLENIRVQGFPDQLAEAKG